MAQQRVRLLIGGLVQGVCFRMYTQMEAGRLGVRGWVRNLDDGRVEVLAEGEPDALGRFVEWCRHGPPHALVSSFTPTYTEATGEFTAFRVAH